jgi:hypothetical protein
VACRFHGWLQICVVSRYVVMAVMVMRVAVMMMCVTTGHSGHDPGVLGTAVVGLFAACVGHVGADEVGCL